MEEKYTGNYYLCYNTLTLDWKPCKKCKPPNYCSKKCQAIGWLQHRKQCDQGSGEYCVMSTINKKGKCKVLSLFNIIDKNIYDYGFDVCIPYNLETLMSTKIVFSNVDFLKHMKIMAYHCFMKDGFTVCDILNHRDGEGVYLCCIYYLPGKQENTKNLSVISAYEYYNVPEKLPMLTSLHSLSIVDCRLEYTLNKKLYSTRRVVEYGVFLKVSKDKCKFMCYDKPR